MNIRTKPTKALKEVTHTASEADYQALARAVVEHIIHRKKDIYLKYPYFATFEDSYPKGIVVRKEGIFDVYKVKVAKLADWLYGEEVLPADYKNLMLAQRDWGYREAKLERLLTSEITLDNNDKLLDNVESVEDNKEEE